MSEFMLKFVELSFKYWEGINFCEKARYLGINAEEYNHGIHFPHLIAKHSYDMYQTVSEYWDEETRKRIAESLE